MPRCEACARREGIITVEMDGAILRGAVLDDDLNLVTLDDLDSRTRRSAVDENHLAGDTILGNVTECQLEVEFFKCGSSRQKLGQQGHSGGELHDIDFKVPSVLVTSIKTRFFTIRSEEMLEAEGAKRDRMRMSSAQE
jgi:hypothetical protein